MPNEARRLASLVDAPQPDDRGNLAFRKDFASQTKALFESFGSPLAGISDAPFADLLRTMASFPTYSLGNQSLIALQAPGSQSVSGAERWTGLGRRLVTNARPIYIWAPADSRATADRGPNGYARPSLERADQIAFSLGLRATQGSDYLFDAAAVGGNALWGGSQSWRAVRAVRIADGGDHIAVKLIMKDGRALDRRARTMNGLVKTLMQAGTSPNDETIAAYLNRDAGQAQPAQGAAKRDFFQKFKMVPVYDVSETDGPEIPDLPAVDCADALKNLIAYLETQKVEVIVSDNQSGMQTAGDQATVYVEAKDDVRAQLSCLLDSAADILSDRRAQAQNRELLKVEREAVKFVLDTHFGWTSDTPELGYGLAPNVEPHAAAEVVKARLVFIRDIAKEIIVGARPGFENPLLKALTQARAPAPIAQPEAAPAQATAVVAPKPAVVKKLEAPKSNAAQEPAGQVRRARAVRVPESRAKAARAEEARIVPAAATATLEDFNPFAEVAAQQDEADFNPLRGRPSAVTANHEYARRMIEAAFMPHVKERRFEILLAMEAHGVPGVHGLNAAVQAGIHEVIGWYLNRNVEPNGDTLVHAIKRGKKAIATILPHTKPNPDHVAVACLARRPDLLKQLLRDMRVTANAKAFKNFFAHQYLTKEAKECIEELIQANETGRVGTMSLLYAMPLLSGSQLGRAIDQAPDRFDLAKLYGHALLCGNQAAVAELRARTPLTLKVIYRAVGQIRGQRGITYPRPIYEEPIHSVLREAQAVGLEALPAKLAAGWCVRMLNRISEEAHSQLNQNAAAPQHPVVMRPALTESLSLALGLIEPSRREKIIQILEAHVAKLNAEPFRAWNPPTQDRLLPQRNQITRNALEAAVAAADAAAAYHTDAAPGL